MNWTTKMMFDFLPTLAQSSDTPVIFWFGRQGALLWVVGPALLAVVLYFLGRKFNLAPLRYAAFLPLLLGLGIGIQSVSVMNDPIFSDYHDVTGRQRMIFIAVVVAPILAAVGLFVAEKSKARQVSSRL